MTRIRILIASAVALVVGVVAVAALAVPGGDSGNLAAAPPNSVPSTTVPQDDTPAFEFEVPIELLQVSGRWNTDWANTTIDLRELKVGLNASDPRDLIRPIDDPKFETIADADAWLEDREPGVLLKVGDVRRFYPLRILASHEVVNDEVDGKPVVITYCPLCNTAAAFDRNIDGRVLRFGVSGLLRKSDLVMWDNATDSLWQQITGQGIVGDFAGTQLEFLDASLVTWGDFKSNFPDSPVLSRDTGSPFNYSLNSYVGYSGRSAPFGSFFDGEIDDRFEALERVVGVRVGDEGKAFPFSVISREQVVNDTVADVPVVVFWGAADTADILDTRDIAAGQAIGTGVAYDRRVDGQTLTFSVAGEDLWKDAETGSTWNIVGLAVDGPLVETQLDSVTHLNDFWFAWSAFNSDAPVYEGAGT